MNGRKRLIGIAIGCVLLLALAVLVRLIDSKPTITEEGRGKKAESSKTSVVPLEPPILFEQDQRPLKSLPNEGTSSTCPTEALVIIRVTTHDGGERPAFDGHIITAKQTTDFSLGSATDEPFAKIKTKIGPAILFIRPASSSAYAPYLERVSIKDGENQLHVMLGRAAVLTGRVVDARGNGVNGAEVTAIVEFDADTSKEGGGLHSKEVEKQGSTMYLADWCGPEGNRTSDVVITEPSYRLKQNQFQITALTDKDGAFAIKGILDKAVKIRYAYGLGKQRFEQEKLVLPGPEPALLMLPVR